MNVTFNHNTTLMYVKFCSPDRIERIEDTSNALRLLFVYLLSH